MISSDWLPELSGVEGHEIKYLRGPISTPRVPPRGTRVGIVLAWAGCYKVGELSKGLCTPCQLLQALEDWPAAGKVLAGRCLRCLQLAGKAKGGVFCWGVLLFSSWALVFCWGVLLFSSWALFFCWVVVFSIDR